MNAGHNSPAEHSVHRTVTAGASDKARPFTSPAELVAQARKAGEEALLAMVQEAIQSLPPVSTNALCAQLTHTDTPSWCQAAEKLGEDLKGPWRTGLSIVMKVGPAERPVALLRIIELMSALDGNPFSLITIAHSLTQAGY